MFQVGINIVWNCHWWKTWIIWVGIDRVGVFFGWSRPRGGSCLAGSCPGQSWPETNCPRWKEFSIQHKFRMMECLPGGIMCGIMELWNYGKYAGVATVVFCSSIRLVSIWIIVSDKSMYRQYY